MAALLSGTLHRLARVFFVVLTSSLAKAALARRDQIGQLRFNWRGILFDFLFRTPPAIGRNFEKRLGANMAGTQVSTPSWIANDIPTINGSLQQAPRMM
jgi:hypothetical protein